jgi:hypothetical protein
LSLPERRAGFARATGVPCKHCSSSYEPEAWLALPLVHVLTDEAIAENVRTWPRGHRIEVRRCAACGRHVARRAKKPPARHANDADR